MKHLIIILLLSIGLVSCDKESDVFPYKNKILKGFVVTSIAFDKLGNAWIGTYKKGLIRCNYNGGSVVFNSSNSIIADNAVINDIAVDSKNNIWIGCNGIVKYDGIKFTMYNSTNTPIPEDNVQSIAIDSKDNVWFTSCRFKLGGIVKYDGTNWNVYTPSNSILPANLVTKISVDKSDNVWLAMTEFVNNAYIIKISNNQWQKYSSNELGFSPYYVSDIKMNSKNKLVCSVDYSLSSTAINKGPKLFSFDGATTFTQITNDEVNSVQNIMIDNKDRVWCTLIGGYALYDGKSWTYDLTTFANDGVFTIKQSPDGRIWIGTGNGICIQDQF
jgi:ligand-binding sensor domain-containing protein